MGKNNAASDALASLSPKAGTKGKKPAAKSKPAAKADPPKVPKKKPAPKKTAPVISKNLADPANLKPKAVPVAEIKKPPGDVFGLVHKCWTLWQAVPSEEARAAARIDAAAAAVVVGYGAGLSVPRSGAFDRLEKLRRVLAKEPEPAPVPPHIAEPAVVPVVVPEGTAENPKPWEPVPPMIRRMLSGEALDAEHGTWFVDFKVWEYKRGWPEPKLTGECVDGAFSSSAEQFAAEQLTGAPTAAETVTVIAETGPGVLGSEPVTLPLNPVDLDGPKEVSEGPAEVSEAAAPTSGIGRFQEPPVTNPPEEVEV